MAVSNPPLTNLIVASSDQAPFREISLRDYANATAKAVAAEFQAPSISEPIDLRLGANSAVQYTIRGRFTKAAAADMAALAQDPSFLSRSIDPAKRQAIAEELSQARLEDLDWTFIVTVVAGRGRLYHLILSTPSSDFEQRGASLREVIGSFTLLPDQRGARVKDQLNLRRSPDPSDNHNLIQALRPGTELDVFEERYIKRSGQQTRWVRIQVRGTNTEGWVNARYLEIISP